MSTITGSYQSTSEDAELEELRRKEAQAREAARIAAERAERERRRAEAERRRVERSHAAIAERNEQFQRVVAKLDEAAGRLPDLELSAPRLPVLGGDVAGEADRLETFAQDLAERVQRFERKVDAAIAQAEYLLQRRIAKAEAWQRCADLEQQCKHLAGASQDLVERLGRSDSAPVLPTRPQAEAELEAVLAYEAVVREGLATLGTHHAELNARLQARERAAELAGPAVTARSAATALQDFDDVRRNSARQALLRHRDERLDEAELEFGQLPAALRDLLDGAVEDAHLQDQRSRVTRWIAQEKQRRDGIERALALLQRVPDLVHDDATLSRRWSVLSARLQGIAGGLEAFGPDVDREYEQLRRDARTLLNGHYASADWVERMRGQGFEVYEREDGAGLVVVDLDHPGIWLEGIEQRAEDGGVLTTLELKTDAAPADEAQVTDAVCSKLREVAGKITPKVASQSEELERKQQITRGIRPAIKRGSSA
ncbi:MAG: hypothetical protein KDI48_13185 [Xanthomonadales bacterium]|nr:hypothetical protein [Xanthomonadales bacterium]